MNKTSKDDMCLDTGVRNVVSLGGGTAMLNGLWRLQRALSYRKLTSLEDVTQTNTRDVPWAHPS